MVYLLEPQKKIMLVNYSTLLLKKWKSDLTISVLETKRPIVFETSRKNQTIQRTNREKFLVTINKKLGQSKSSRKLRSLIFSQFRLKKLENSIRRFLKDFHVLFLVRLANLYF